MVKVLLAANAAVDAKDANSGRGPRGAEGGGVAFREGEILGRLGGGALGLFLRL